MMQKSATLGLATTRDRSETSGLLTLCLATVAIFSNMYATQPVLPVIGHEFGLSPSTAGLTVSSLVFAIAFSSIFYGFLTDRIGRRAVIIGSAFALSVPTLLCAMAPTFEILLLCRIGQGLIIPGFIATTITYIHEEYPHQRGSAVGWYTASTVTGGFTGRLQGGLMTDFVNWRFAFVTFALANLVVGFALVRNLPQSRHFSRPVREQVRAGWRRFDISQTGIVACLKNRKLLGAYILGPAIFFPFIGLFTYLPYYLSGGPFYLPNLWVSLIFVVYLIGVVAAPTTARFSDRLGRPNIMQIGLLIMAVGIGLTLIPSLAVVFTGLLALCFGMFTVQSTTNAFIGDSAADGKARGSAVALYQMFFYTGGSLGGFVPGLLWQSGGWLPLVAGCLASLTIGFVAVRRLTLDA